MKLLLLQRRSGKPLFLFVCLFRAILEGLRENSVLIDVELNISNNEVSVCLTICYSENSTCAKKIKALLHGEKHFIVFFVVK